jgi:hypothetical protein
MSEELNQAPEMEAQQVSEAVEKFSEGDEVLQNEDVAKLLKALKSEREARKTYERQNKEKEKQLEKFAEINPEEYKKLQADVARAAEIESRYGESIRAIEEKYGRQAAEAESRAKELENSNKELLKRYALEKVFNAAGGRTDAGDGVSFFDMFADQLSSRFKQEADGSLTPLDEQGDPILDSETGKRLTPEEFVNKFKAHPVYGTFFKGVKGSGAGIAYGGTDTNGLPIEDISGLSRDELFLRAFG